jgi:hypothetical protein
VKITAFRRAYLLISSCLNIYFKEKAIFKDCK